MKFSELLGEPEPEPESELPGSDAEPISVFAPVPVSPPPTAPPLPSTLPEPAPPPVSGPPPLPDPVPPTPTPAYRRELTEPPSAASPAPPPAPGSRSGLAELNVRQPVPEPLLTEESSLSDQLVGLTEIVDDLLPQARRGRK